MTSRASPDAEVLGKILLLQSEILTATDDRRMAEILTTGFGRVPGVASAAFCRQGTVEPPSPESPEPPASCRAAFVTTSGERTCPLPWPCATDGIVRLGLRSSRQCFGGILLKISDAETFFLYQPFLENTANLAALLMENRAQDGELRAAGGDLERKIEARTAALRASENLYRTLVENVDMGITLIDRDYHVVMTNAATGELLRKPACELVGKHCFEVFEKKPVVCPHCPGKVAMDTGLPDEAVISAVRDDGTRYSVRVRAFPVRNADGTIFGFIEVVQDITRQQQAEQALQESLARQEQSSNFLTTLLSAIPVPVFYMDAAGRYIDCNRAFSEFTGKTRPDLSGKTVAEIWPGPKANAYLARDLALIRDKREEVFECKVPHADGGERDVIFSKAVFRGTHKDELAGAVGAFIDITGRKRAERDLRRLDTAVRQAAECIVITDPDGLIEYVNPAFEKTSGYRTEEVLGKTSSLLKSGKQNPEFYENLWKTLRGGGIWSGRFINRRKDGTLYHEDATISPVRDEQGQIVQFVAVKRDVTREVELEAQFQQAQKMEAVGRLAGGVAHDFNNLLTAIKGNLALAISDTQGNVDIQEFLRDADKAADRAAALTRQLLVFSRKQVVEPRIVNLNELLQGFKKMLGRLIGEHIEFHVEPGDNLGRIKADPSQIEQMILNLAVNSRDAMPDGGTLRISAANIVLDEFFCEFYQGLKPGKYVVLAVADTGCGMSEEVKRHLYEPFFTTKSVGKGTGLGLAMVYAFVKQNNGAIAVESEPGKGSTFRIYLPRTFETPGTEILSQGQNPALNGTETILFVEDDEALRQLVKRILERRGYRVLACAGGAEALSTVQQLSHPIDLLVTDVIMPGMNGRELSERLQAVQPGLKTLFTSGYTADVLGRSGVLDEGIEFIPKPYGQEVFLKKLRQLLDGRDPAGSKVLS